jgi:hypothetical protein
MQTATVATQTAPASEGAQTFTVELTAADLLELFTGRLVGRHQETLDEMGDDVDAYFDSHPIFRHIPDDPHRIYARLAVDCPEALAALESVRVILKAKGVEDEAEAQSAVLADYWYD